MDPNRPVKPPPNRKKAISLILVSWIFFTSVIALSRFASANSSVPTVLLFQNLISFCVTLPFVIKNGKKSLYLSKFGLIILRSLAGYVSYAFIFLAVQRTSLVNVVLLSNSAPLFIPIIIWLWRRVKISATLWLGIVVGFIGIALILKPTEHIINLGGVFGVGAAICFSISMIAQRRLAKTVPIYTIMFYYFLISSIISIPFTIETWTPPNKETWILLITIGLLFVTGQFFFLSAFKYEKPSFLSSFNYSAVIYGVIIEWILWDQFPDWLSILGIFVVCTGGILTILQGNGIPPKRKDQSSNQ